MSRIGVLIGALAAAVTALTLSPSPSEAGYWFNQGGDGSPRGVALMRCIGAVAGRTRLPMAAVSVRGLTQFEGSYAVTLFSNGSYGCTVGPGGNVVELIRLYATSFPPYSNGDSPYVIQCRFACPINW